METCLPAIFGFIGTLLGAGITAFIAWLTSQNTGKQQYYNEWIKKISNHNWNLLNNKVDPGLDISPNNQLSINVLCYEHLNLLLFAWLNKSIIKKDKTEKGWQNWVEEIKKGWTK